MIITWAIPIRKNLYLTQAAAFDDAQACAAVAIRSFGDFQNFHPYLHVLATDGCFYNDAAFMVCSPPDTGELCSNRPEIAMPAQKINLDNKTRFS
jgi:hypothetical protein